MKRAARNTAEIGGAIKGIIMLLGSLAIFALAVYWLTQGEWVRTLVLVFIIEPVWLFVSDFATAIVLAPLVGLAQLFGRRES